MSVGSSVAERNGRNSLIAPVCAVGHGGWEGGRRRSSSLISPGGSAFTSTSGYLQEHLLVLRETKIDVKKKKNSLNPKWSRYAKKC